MSVAAASLGSPVLRRPRLSREGMQLPAITCAFQPIVDARSRTIIAYEALLRGNSNEAADSVIQTVPQTRLSAFDEHCRAVAIAQASRLGLACDLNLNLMPHTVQLATDCLATTVAAARRCHLPLDRIVIEITEREALGNEERLTELALEYRGHGMRIALDDFGSGYSGLNLLADFQPDQLKLDRTFARGINRLGPRQAIARALIQVCHDLGIDLIAEGIESVDEFHWFCDEGIHLFQGFLFAHPGFESLPVPNFP